MKPLSRRQFVVAAGAGTAAGLVACCSHGWAEEALQAALPGGVNWPSRVIKLPADDGEFKPPVVSAVRLHRSGQMLATAGDDHLVRVWNLLDGQRRNRLDGHTDWVRSIDYSPDGRLLASGGNDRRILLWDAESGSLVRELAKLEHAIAGLRFSHDGAFLASVGFGGTLHVHNVADGGLLLARQAPCEDMRAVAFSPDDATLACGGRSGAIRLLTTRQGDFLRDVAAHRQRIRAVAYSPDGSFLASAGEDRHIHIVPIGQEASSYNLPLRPAKVMSLVFYAPNLLAAAGSDNQIRLWDVAARAEIGMLTGHTGSVAALDCQEGLLVSAGYDTTIRVWTISDHIAGDKRDGEGRLGALPGSSAAPQKK